MEAALARPLDSPPQLRPLTTTRPAALLLLPSSVRIQLGLSPQLSFPPYTPSTDLFPSAYCEI